jgi:hypothetical protein
MDVVRNAADFNLDAAFGADNSADVAIQLLFEIFGD